MSVPITSLLNKRLMIYPPYLSQLVLESVLHNQHPAPPTRASDPKISLLATASSSGVSLTNDITAIDSGDEVVFYHPIEGVILAEQEYYYDWGKWEWRARFSSRTFLCNLLAADASPNVIAHFVHVNSCGGEAWLLDVVARTLRECKKPIYCLFEQNCCSAALWIAVNAQILKAYTPNCTVGSLGVMSRFVDVSGYWEQLGVKELEIYATNSDLKHKKVKDVLAGHPEDFIKTVLDPCQTQFEQDVRSARPQLDALGDNHPIFRGETFMASEAVELGLIDGIQSNFSDALREAYELGVKVRNNNSLLTNL